MTTAVVNHVGHPAPVTSIPSPAVGVRGGNPSAWGFEIWDFGSHHAFRNPQSEIIMELTVRQKRQYWWRRVRAIWRDTLLLLRQFWKPLIAFFAAIILSGLLYYDLAILAGQPIATRGEAIYTMLTATFLESPGEFPDVWYLQTFYFLMPIIGLSILAQGLADFGILFFNRKARSKEWEMAVASTFSNHMVLVGLGHLGFRVMEHLHSLDQAMVVIELQPEDDLVQRAKEMGIPVIADDASRLTALESAGVKKARAILLCTQKDSLNLQIAFKARRLNPQISVVIRIFDYEFANDIEQQFGFRAMSATGMAAPAFAAAAAEVDITRPIMVEGEALSLARLDIKAGSKLNGRSVSHIEQTLDISIVLVRHNHETDFHPSGDRLLSSGDVIAVLGGSSQISRLAEMNQ